LTKFVTIPAPSGTGAVERDGGDDVLEAVGAEVLEELLHARGLELEDALGFAGAEEDEGGLVVEGMTPRSKRFIPAA